MKTVSRKIGSNRGKPRLWLEGAILIAAGFKPGDRWTLKVNGAALHIVRDPQGKRKIAGKGDKPIVDITGASLGDEIGRAERVAVHANSLGLTAFVIA